MRRLLVAVLLLSAALPVAPAQAAPEPLLQDEAGDTSFVSGVPGAQPTPAVVPGQSEGVDLTALHVEEADESLLLVLHLAKLEGTTGEYVVHFTWRDTEYRAVARRQSNAFGSFAFAYLESSFDGDWERVAPLEIVVDGAKSTVSVLLPKIFILDGQKRAPALGDVLTNVNVRADAAVARFRFVSDEDYPASFQDRMPNEGEGAALPLRLGDVAAGTLSLRTDDRVRVSNGGSTTFVFKATLTNNGSREDEVSLTLVDMPDGWNGSVQSPVKVPAGGERTITVLASVPFEHKHGGHDSFRVQAQSERDPGSHASLRLGVLHTPIPQPAGHHPDLYLHAAGQPGNPVGQALRSAFPFARGFLNTESTHEGESEGVTFDSFRGDRSGWTLPLNPSLRMGLDFDVEKTGTLTGSIKGGSGPATLAAKLLLVRMGEDGGVLVAESDETEVALDAQKATPFTLTLTPTPDADYIPYEKDQNLELHISYEGSGPHVTFGPMQPLLLAQDFKLSLPLLEYHDRLTGLGEAEEGLQFVADGVVEKVGRPGTVMTYAFDLKNTGREVTIDLDVAGTDARLGVVVPSAAFKLPAGETKRVTLAVGIPGDATTGEQLEVLVFAHAQEDPSLTALVRTLTTVSTGANATDDETDVLLAARDAEMDTPGFTAALLGLALVAVALALRRR